MPFREEEDLENTLHIQQYSSSGDSEVYNNLYRDVLEEHSSIELNSDITSGLVSGDDSDYDLGVGSDDLTGSSSSVISV